MTSPGQTDSSDTNHHDKPSNQNPACLSTSPIVDYPPRQSRRVPNGTRDCLILNGIRPLNRLKPTPQASYNGFGTPQNTIPEITPPNSETTQGESAFGILYQPNSDATASVELAISGGQGTTSAYQPRFFTVSE
ncbi:unnamed protein product [marine sediment metagenome]|uniref:Uncharacterized protein n=1 Tax=marine sediment metagenome TaxID=412755 RepID=X1PWD0_9ZZZZ